ncbi:MAG: hypothetical protein IKS59_01725 [Aeriscardovia sp.]|nr:hypothetical protein [Aeriscardovia sp.]
MSKKGKVVQLASSSYQCSKVRVSVPASCTTFSSLGTVGCALNIRDTFTVEERTTFTDSVTIKGEGYSTDPKDSSNLLIQVIKATRNVLGEAQTGLNIICENRIPQACGLGSSASTITAGVTAALALSPSYSPKRDLICDLAAQMEGSIGNVAASVYGGVATGWYFDRGTQIPNSVVTTQTSSQKTQNKPFETYADGWHTAVSPISSQISAILLIPTNHLNDRARLPKGTQFTPNQTQQIAAQSTTLFQILTQPSIFTMVDLFAITGEQVHLTNRDELLPDSWQLMTHLRSLGYPAFITGAGPAIIMFYSDSDSETKSEEKILTTLRQSIAREWLGTGRWYIKSISFDRQGIEIIG